MWRRWHTHTHTHFPQRSCALTGKVGGCFFSCLWKMEACFMTHVPCPPVRITPAVFQGCSTIGRLANENNRVCGEETKQTRAKERKTPSWTEIPAAGPELYPSSEEEALTGAAPGGTRLLRGNHTWQSPRARWTSWACSRRLFWLRPHRDAAVHGPTAWRWLAGRTLVCSFSNTDLFFPPHILSSNNKNE